MQQVQDNVGILAKPVQVLPAVEEHQVPGVLDSLAAHCQSKE